MAEIYPSLEDMVVDKMAKVSLLFCLFVCLCFIIVVVVVVVV